MWLTVILVLVALLVLAALAGRTGTRAARPLQPGVVELLTDGPLRERETRDLFVRIARGRIVRLVDLDSQADEMLPPIDTPTVHKLRLLMRSGLIDGGCGMGARFFITAHGLGVARQLGAID